MTGYQYWLIRYVPNAVRGEFVNIGVLVGMDGKDWALRTVDSFTRASLLAEMHVKHGTGWKSCGLPLAMPMVRAT